jgi:adenine-specific DNA-methyltransferase
MPRKSSDSKRNIEATIHKKDKRTNIPTKELSGFVKEDEDKPRVIRYPRDTSLDPQLVWTGKDEQDSKDLEVPAVPVYIQEKIHPKYIIEDLRSQARKAKSEQLQLFADFNGLKFEDLIEFYQHEQSWANRMILGDSLLVMNSLAEKEGLKAKVQMIYIDPPYGISFSSNWQVSTRKRDVKDGKAEDATRQPEQIKAFRDTWKLRINSYLAYLRDRLFIARQLLSETGSIFVQIGDENVHLVRCLMDEVFGSENFTSQMAFRTAMTKPGKGLGNVFDYVLWYAKNSDLLKYRQLFVPKDSSDGESYHQIQASVLQNRFEFVYKGIVYNPRNGWRTTKDGLENLARAGRLYISGGEGGTLKFIRLESDFPFNQVDNLVNQQSSEQNKIYVVQTANKVIERCLLMTTDPADLVLDPTCGSGTTAYVAEQWGRRWITIDTSRVALALARTRIMSARFPYYLLADSPEGIKKEAELTGQVPPAYKTENDVRKGFVYKRVPHITLKSIANNPDIKEGLTREEIDAAIAHNAETETLYDQPYEDSKRIRVTGPFTVESLSPHRVISSSEEMPASEIEARREAGMGTFENMISDNLRKAGVQNTVRNERLHFDRLEPYPGQWLHAQGEYTEKDGMVKRVAVCIGPEHSTVTSDLVKEAAKEAVKGAGFDLLVICGFAFDAYVSEEAKQFGKLNILITRMNPDLAMGDELLKTISAANLFMVFGEPDVDIKKQKDGKIVVKINGVDVYDPTTGAVRSHSTDDIACWFIDTDYNEESFFVRHAYFLGDDNPYEKLKRSLKAEIDEAVWSSLYSAESRPFDPPSTGKIAIKVINHYGDEVLKVYEVK